MVDSDSLPLSVGVGEVVGVGDVDEVVGADEVVGVDEVGVGEPLADTLPSRSIYSWSRTLSKSIRVHILTNSLLRREHL